MHISPADLVRSGILSLSLLATFAGCSTTTAPADAGTGGFPGGQAGNRGDSGDAIDAAIADRANNTCSYPEGYGPPDGGTFNTSCAPSCPAGTVCVFEIGGVAGGGGEYCAPIPSECHGTAGCSCMAACVCTNTFGGRPETCTEMNGQLACDNGVR